MTPARRPRTLAKPQRQHRIAGLLAEHAVTSQGQLVDLLVAHWSDIPREFQERLGLKPGLVLA